jgi:PHD/YefM family antitoxin component YafN of YafNO toxin-antitoxin module
MKIVRLESMPDLDAVVKEIYQSEELEPIVLMRGTAKVAVIVSCTEYNAMKRLEDALLDKSDVDESAEILKDPQWIDWDQVQKQLKS